MIRIFLTGYMGAGKTTLGKAFARELNIPFIDLDWYIEERLHKSIRELFIERGEASMPPYTSPATHTDTKCSSSMTNCIP